LFLLLNVLTEGTLLLQASFSSIKCVLRIAEADAELRTRGVLWEIPVKNKRNWK
jgi:hypothetical protein